MKHNSWGYSSLKHMTPIAKPKRLSGVVIIRLGQWWSRKWECYNNNSMDYLLSEKNIREIFSVVYGKQQCPRNHYSEKQRKIPLQEKG